MRYSCQYFSGSSMCSSAPVQSSTFVPGEGGADNGDRGFQVRHGDVAPRVPAQT